MGRIKFCGLYTGAFLLLNSNIGFADTIPAAVEPGRVETRFKTAPKPRAVARVRKGLESTIPPARAARIPLRINSFSIKGSTVFSKEELNKVVAPFRKKKGTLLDAFQAAAALTSFYGDRGYLLSRTIVPPQELEPNGAIITLQVLEGYIDQVNLPEKLGSRTRLMQGYKKGIVNQRPLQADQLERQMLLANDIPGLSVRSNLSASPKKSGASHLTLTTKEDPSAWSFRIDNRGTKASGPLQITLAGELNNSLNLNEKLSGGITLAGPSEDSNKPELAYVFADYDQVITPKGLRFNVGINVSRGDPDNATLSALDYETEGENISVGLSYPFIRTRSKNLTGSINFDFKNSKSTNFSGIASEDRLRIFRAELDYDKADKNNGTNQVQFAISKGVDAFGSTNNSNANASRTPGKVDFFKATLSLSRTQNLGKNFSVLGRVFGQWTDDPLLSSQECGYGGQQFGRGFDSSVITGDTCLNATVELRKNIQQNGALSALNLNYIQAYTFADTGRISNISAPLGTPDSDSATSAGLGLRFGKGRISFDVSATKPIDTPNSTAVSDGWMGWVNLTTQF